MAILSYVIAASPLQEPVDKQKLESFIWELLAKQFLRCWRAHKAKPMANSEHLDIFKLGKQIWNRWRKEHPNIRPDLSEIMPYSPELIDFDLETSQANLRNALLRGSNLPGYAFFRSQLQGVGCKLLVEENIGEPCL